MIINLTQHAATAEQLAAGVVDLDADRKAYVSELLTFVGLPNMADVLDRAQTLAAFAYVVGEDMAAEGEEVCAMIGGAPFLMAALEAELKSSGIKPCYAFSERVSEEQTQADGSVRKINVFKHVGFVWAEV